MHVAAVVVNYNGGRWNSACLESLASAPLLSSIVFVDNASTDGSYEDAVSQYGQDARFVFLPLDKNYLFARGCNAGMAKALDMGADHVLLLNNDAHLEESCLEQLSSFLDNHNQAAAVQPVLVQKSSLNSINSAGCRFSFCGLAWDHAAGQSVDNLPQESFAMGGVTGGASLWRASVLREIGLFDADFRMYFEDVDLSMRAREAGWELCTLPSARVLHMGGATTGAEAPSGFCVHLCVRNAVRLVCRHWPSLWILPALLCWLGGNGLACVANIKMRHFDLARAYLRGLWEGSGQIPICLFERLRNWRKHRGRAQLIRPWIEWRHLLPPRPGA